MHLSNYLALIERSEYELAKAFDAVARQHIDEPDVLSECLMMAGWSRDHAKDLAPFIEHYGAHGGGEPEALHNDLFKGPRSGGLGLLRDLHDLYVMATEARIAWTVLTQAAAGLRDAELKRACERMNAQTERQLQWLLTRLKAAAPQALIAAK